MFNSNYYLVKVGKRGWLCARNQYTNDSCICDDNIVEVNETGVVIWESLMNNDNYEKIAGYISREYGITYKEALKDVKDYVASLKLAGIITD